MVFPSSSWSLCGSDVLYRWVTFAFNDNVSGSECLHPGTDFLDIAFTFTLAYKR